MSTGGRIALCPGTYDPVTYGHLDIVERASRLFPHVVVSVAEGSTKKQPLFTADERRNLVRMSIEHLGNVEVTGFNCLLAAHAREVGAHGLMVIPRVLSRGSSPAAQKEHFRGILKAGGDLPAVIYNSPYYGFETKADLFFALNAEFPSLIGFKEFGGAKSLSYAAEFITSVGEQLTLMAGVDTQVYHGFVNCGATGAITGVGNALPTEILRYIELCKAAAQGDAQARRCAQELSEALTDLSTFDEGPDLVLYYKELMVLEGHEAYRHQIYGSDKLSPSQKQFLHTQWQLFRDWWAGWDGRA
jgi:4-hydroxy-tetrahydrodipicolinate synthase